MYDKSTNLEKHELTVPKYYWKAFCYEGEETVYSWVYLQENDDTQKKGSGDFFMSPKFG